ncbi:MAG: prepilin-type N-terminal cleavage/methylation domain-containing protein [Leucobacter sp.]
MQQAPQARLAQGRKQRGFTIVELLIVVVVIAVLAAITIVAYNGITGQAKEAVLKSDLSTTAKKVGLIQVETGSYPSSAPADTPNSVQYSGGGNSFCVTGSANGKSFRIKESGSLEEGDCAAPVATTMQTFTGSHCSALATFTGSNTSAVVSLTDSRGGTTRTYEVAKLADGNCWMLNNLKLGSTTSTTTLTPADSNVASNFTLPQLTTSGATEYDLPRAYGSIPGDTGSGTTNYGYFYNFSAATAGETRTTLTTGNAPYSICPANWRLPTGGSTGEFAWLNAKMNNPSAAAPSTATGSGYYQNWQPTGPLKGLFSGVWDAGFDGQGGAGLLWSASARPGGSDSAFSASFGPSDVRPGDDIDARRYGIGVRCLLN